MLASIGASGLILFSLLGDKVLGQSSSSQADVKPLCFQPTVSSSPNASTLAGFITPSIQAACSFFVNNATASADIDLFNSTGYVFTRLAIVDEDEDEPVPDEAECQRAFSSIVATCVQDGTSFGGQWSPRIELSYMISNKAYPLNPLKVSDPPSTTTSAGPSATTTKATTSITSTTTAPPVPPSHSQTGKEIHEEALLVLLAAVAFLAVSFIPGVGIAAGITAALAIEKGFPVMNNALKTLPPTAKVAKLTGALEAVKFTGVVSRILPNPAMAGILVSVATLALETAAEVAQEAEENEDSSSSTTESQASSTTSSTSPGPTQHVVAWSSKWPDLLVDAMVQGLPGDGEGHREDFDALGLKVYVTEMTDFLGDAISILPVFKFIVGNSAVESELDRGDRYGVNAERRRRRETMADQKLQRRGPGDGVQNFKGKFPLLPFISLDRTRTPADHLKLLSYKKPDHVDYVHNKGNGEGITIYVVDSGFGNAQTSTRSTDEFNKEVISHVLKEPSGSNLYDNAYYRCTVEQGEPLPVLSALDDAEDGHGTCVASMAASRRYGSARNAQIISWKDAPNDQECSAKAVGLLRLFSQIIDDVAANNGQKKTIVNLSTRYLRDDVEPIMIQVVDRMTRNDIVWTASAGTHSPHGNHAINGGFPQSLVDLSSDKVNTSPAIIVVSGIDSSAPESADRVATGDWDSLDHPIISVYARHNVECLTPDFRGVHDAGTSFATPTVAGMIADWLSDPAIVKAIEKEPGERFPHKVRNFLRSASIARNKDRPYINTAYNGYREWWCKFKSSEGSRSGLQLAAAADDEGRLTSNDTLLEARDDAEEDDEPLVVSGTIVIPDYTEKPTCISTSDLPSSQTSSDPVTSSSITISSTLSSSTIITSSTAAPDVCSDEAGISCDDCNGSFSRGGNVRAVCTTGPATGCACTPTARTCGSGTPAPCDRNGCDGRWDGGGWNATCRVNFPTCPCTPTDATCGPASARSCQEDNCQGSVSNGVATCNNAFKGCACTPSCTIKQPAVPAASSVALNLYNASCCESASLKTIQVSDLGMCQGVDVDFRAVTQAVGQSLFGRGIKVQLFTDPACVDLAPFVMGLTNTPACASSPGLLLPFRGIILTNGTNPGTGTGTTPPPACTTQQPNLVNADTVSVNLYSKSCCDAAPASTVQLDTLSRCVNTSPFRDFTQTVGQNMFGRKIRVLGYTSKGCQGTASATWGLTNTKQCQPATDPNAVYQSIMIFRDGDSTPVNSCGVSPVNPNNNPTTVAMTFFSDGRCCDDVANMTVGVAGTCRNLAGGAEWNSVRMAAGTNLDDTGYDVQLFTQPDCADGSSLGALPVANLATAKSCQGAGKTYKSFRLRAPAAPPTPPAPSCANRPAAVADAAIFQLYKGSQCCTPVQTSIAKVDGCVSVKGGFDHYTETVAQNLFGRGLEVQLFAESGCAGAAWTEYPTNKAVCRDSPSPPGGWLSLRLASPPPVEQCDARPAVVSADSIALQVYHDECCFLSQKLTAKVNKCVASASTFSGFKEAVGQNLFGRGIKLFVYSDTKCASGEYYELDITNNDLCWAVPGRSFILKTPEPTCAAPADNDGNSNTAALTLFKNAECCVGASSGNGNYLKGLAVGVCRTAAQNFRGFDLEVGQNLFGKGNKLVTYTAADCTGTSISWDMSNKYTCFDPGRTLRSVKIVPPAVVVKYNEGVVLEGGDTLVQIAWAEGQNPCRLGGEINRWHPAVPSTYRSICGTVVCAGGKCFTFQDCSQSNQDLHIEVQGAPGKVYSRCTPATQDVTVCSKSNGDLFDGQVHRYYACR